MHSANESTCSCPFAANSITTNLSNKEASAAEAQSCEMGQKGINGPVTWRVSDFLSNTIQMLLITKRHRENASFKDYSASCTDQGVERGDTGES